MLRLNVEIVRPFCLVKESFLYCTTFLHSGTALNTISGTVQKKMSHFPGLCNITEHILELTFFCFNVFCELIYFSFTKWITTHLKCMERTYSVLQKEESGQRKRYQSFSFTVLPKHY